MSDAGVDPKSLIGYELPDKKIAYTKRDAIIYALGIGVHDLRFVYELDSDFGVFPTFAAVMSTRETHWDTVEFTVKNAFGDIPNLKINPAMILHGENYTEVVNPLPPQGGEFINKTRIANIYDKGKGALLEIENTTKDAAGKVYQKSVSSLFIRGMGNFGGERGPQRSGENLPPSRAPDAVQEYKTDPYQTHLYRLSGDYNPLHIDPNLAQMVGFKSPILHGLCSYGHCARAVMENFCNNDPKRFKSIRVRFASPFFPGDTFVIKMWKEGENKVILEMSCKETGKVVISNAVVELNAPASSSSSGGSGTSVTLKSAPIFDMMNKALGSNPGLYKKINAVYQFNLKAESGDVVSYAVDAKTPGVGVKQGAAGKPDCTITMSDGDYFDMATGKLNPMAAFGQGKLKISGNAMLAQKLSALTEAGASL